MDASGLPSEPDPPVASGWGREGVSRRSRMSFPRRAIRCWRASGAWRCSPTAPRTGDDLSRALSRADARSRGERGPRPPSAPAARTGRARGGVPVRRGWQAQLPGSALGAPAGVDWVAGEARSARLGDPEELAAALPRLAASSAARSALLLPLRVRADVEAVVTLVSADEQSFDTRALERPPRSSTRQPPRSRSSALARRPAPTR